VSTLLAQAVLEKKASLQDDIRKFLPGSYPNLQWNGAPIRLVNLANHTSGLPSSFHQYSPAVTNALRGKTLAEQADFFGT
jgi:CubicO group peptidase (beta-lactamase class C family)